jgi:predicted phosphodiesterase
MKTFTKKQVATEYSRRFPNTPNKTLARAMFAREKKLFPSLSAAYACVRYVRGTIGKRSARNATDPKPLRFIESIPESKCEVREDFLVDTKERILVLSDIHFPHHSKPSLEAAIAYGKKLNPTVVYLNGDTVENYALSRWEPDPRKRDLPEEIKLARQGLRYIRERFPKARLIFKHGNHEARSEDYLKRKAPELLGVEDFKLSSLLRFDELRITEVALLQVAKFGKLNVIHGHELPKGISNPVNAARGMFLRLAETSMCGHFHQTSQHTEARGIKKEVVSCWTTGCLCGLQPDYAIINKWNHGFAVVETDKSGEFEVRNLKIIGGKVF